MPEVSRIRAYEVTRDGDPSRPSFVRSRSAGAARMEVARVLAEVGYEDSVGKALKRLRVRRAPALDAFPVNPGDHRRTGDAMGDGYIPQDNDGRPIDLGQCERDAAAFNVAHPVGTRVRYWTGALRGEGREGVTSGPAYVLCGTAVAAIAGVPGGVALTHVLVLDEEATR